MSYIYFPVYYNIDRLIAGRAERWIFLHMNKVGGAQCGDDGMGSVMQVQGLNIFDTYEAQSQIHLYLPRQMPYCHDVCLHVVHLISSASDTAYAHRVYTVMNT